MAIYAAAKNLKTFDFSKLSYIGELEIKSKVMTDMSSFRALTEIGGKLNIEAADLMTSFDGTSLKTIGGQLRIYNNPLLKNINIKGIQIKDLYIGGTTLPDLNLTGDDIFDGAFSLNVFPSTLATMPTITGFKTVKSLLLYTGYNYRNNIELKGIEIVKEELHFSSCSNVKIFNLPNLKETGTIKFTYCNEVRELNLPALEKITSYTKEGTENILGGFNFNVTSNIEKINLSSLKTVIGDFKVESIDSDATITKIDAPKLETVSGAFIISGQPNSKFNDLSTFAALKSVASVSISKLSGLSSFEGLKGLISTLESTKWTVSDCAYNPTYQDMVDEKYDL